MSQSRENDVTSQSAFTCSKLTIETLEQGVKYVTGLSRTFFKEFKDIFLRIPGQSRTHFIYLEKLQDIQGQLI